VIFFIYRPIRNKPPYQYEDNYSPFIVDIVLPEEVTVKHLSEMYERFFEDELFSGKYHSFMEVHFEEKIKEKDLAFVYQMVGELISRLNRYTAEEFKRDKDKEEYRYRGDWDLKNI